MLFRPPASQRALSGTGCRDTLLNDLLPFRPKLLTGGERVRISLVARAHHLNDQAVFDDPVIAVCHLEIKAVASPFDYLDRGDPVGHLCRARLTTGWGRHR